MRVLFKCPMEWLTSPFLLQSRHPQASVAVTWGPLHRGLLDIHPPPPHLEDFGGRDEAGQGRGEGGSEDASCDQGCKA